MPLNKHQTQMDSSLGHAPTFHQVSTKLIQNVLSEPTNNQTNKPSNMGPNIGATPIDKAVNGTI